nr:T9SS type A sorting domain-containing protein [Bacteroidota bacterium]
YNNLGKVVYEQIEKLYPDNATYSINVSSFRQGVYFVNIRMGNNIFVVRKFVKLP